jgi:hypothetical protein
VLKAFVEVVRKNLPLELKNTRITSEDIIDVYQNWLRPVTLRERFSATEGSLVSLSEMLCPAQHDRINLCKCQYEPKFGAQINMSDKRDQP